MMAWLTAQRLVRGMAVVALIGGALQAAPAPQIFEWERGIGLRIPGEPSADMFFWVYEWNMFGAMQAGPSTHGTYQLKRTVAADRGSAIIDSPALTLRVRSVADGAELELRVTNLTESIWPAVAGVIPCWNPGQLPGTNPSMPLPLNHNFSDPWRTRSFFLSTDGLSPLASRAMHFNARHRGEAEQLGEHGRFSFSYKWPTSDVDAVGGLLVRESEDGRWATGVAWEDFLSVQGHNPWYCLHTCARVGALKPGQSRTLRGRLYLLAGTKEDVLRAYRRDFGGK